MKYEPRIALATITETREQFRKIRTPMVEEEANAISWLRKDAQVLESPPLISVEDVKSFANSIKQFDAHVLVIHIPVWTDPVLSVKLSQMIDRPLLCNSTNDADGEKNPVVHACEADMDAALTMQILNLISNGKPVALLDMRWLDVRNGLWTLANCGAFPMDFGATESDKSGLSSVEIAPHIIGKVGACALPMVASPQKVTLARLCRNKGKYWMAIIRGQIQQRNHEDLKKTTAVFPQAYVKTTTGYDFLEKFGSNHCHMVAGNFAADLKIYCELTDIDFQIWQDV